VNWRELKQIGHSELILSIQSQQQIALAGLQAFIGGQQKLTKRKLVFRSEFCMLVNPTYTVRTYSMDEDGES
jgi:hypothetical protein